jgi:hypothetical protein
VRRAWAQSFGSEWLGFGTREGLAHACAGLFGIEIGLRWRVLVAFSISFGALADEVEDGSPAGA